MVNFIVIIYTIVWSFNYVYNCKSIEYTQLTMYMVNCLVTMNIVELYSHLNYAYGQLCSQLTMYMINCIVI